MSNKVRAHILAGITTTGIVLLCVGFILAVAIYPIVWIFVAAGMLIIMFIYLPILRVAKDWLDETNR